MDKTLWLTFWAALYIYIIINIIISTRDTALIYIAYAGKTIKMPEITCLTVKDLANCDV